MKKINWNLVGLSIIGTLIAPLLISMIVMSYLLLYSAASILIQDLIKQGWYL